MRLHKLERTPLFSDVPQRLGKATRSETRFQFLERGGRPECAQVRAHLERLFSLWGDTKHALGLRLRNEDQFDGAVFELIVNGILRQSGCQVEHEPKIEGTDTTKKIDFRCWDESGAFYVEATVCGMEKGHQKGALVPTPKERDFEDRLWDAVNRDPQPPCLMSVRADGDWPSDVNPKDMANQIRAKANGLGKSVGIVSCRFPDDDGWLVVDFDTSHAILRGIHTGGIGRGFAFVPSGKPIRKALVKKARKYKAVDAPLYLAVNVQHADALINGDHGCHLEAIYGERNRREGPFVPDLASVDGVLVFGGMGHTFGGTSPWNLHTTHVQLCMNDGKHAPTSLRRLLPRSTVSQALDLPA